MVVFAEQNVIDDPPFSKLDLISCRNLLIYLGPELQKKVIPLFHYALNENCFLFLGNSESIGDFIDLFAPLDRKWKLFQRKGAASARRALPDFAIPSLLDELTAGRAVRGAQQEEKTTLRELAEKALLAEHTPACVIINEKCEILYIHGRTGKYLEPSPGEVSVNILGMAREGLRLELATAIRNVIAHKKAVHYQDLPVKTNGDTQTINLLVKPILKPAAMQSLLLVIFEDVTPDKLLEEVETTGAAGEDKEQHVGKLERELRAKEEYLQTTIEEMETANEELKSTNEELQSTNEELQSTNEELETSKEELQSVNEELVTVNMELQKKIEELSRANNDMNNLLAGTEIATVFVDHQLHIQRFTPAITRLINLIQTDIGRPIGHIVSNLAYDNLGQDIQAVLDKLVPKEAEVCTTDGRWYLMRILPYRTLENVIEGAVLTFMEITEQKRMQEELHRLSQAAQEAREYAENILDTVREPLLVLDAELKVVSASRSFYGIFRTKPAETEGRRVYDLGNKEWHIPELERLLADILPQESTLSDFEVRHNFETIGPRTMLLNAREIKRGADRERLILLAIEDVTEHREAGK
jgi:two-component system CheB/CheR fusion protein